MATPASKQPLGMIHDGENFKIVNTKTGKVVTKIPALFDTKEKAEGYFERYKQAVTEEKDDREPIHYKGAILTPVEGKKTYKFKINEHWDPNAKEREMSLSAAQKFIREYQGKPTPD